MTTEDDHLDDTASREDDDYIKRIDRWKRLRAERKLIKPPSDDLIRMADEIEAVEGRIISGYPLTFRGLNVLLEMIYDILAARDIEQGQIDAHGPVTMLVARAAKAVECCEGELYRKRGAS